MTPLRASERLVEALRTVPDLRVSIGIGHPVVPPAVVVGAPALDWDGYCGRGPTLGRWPVYLISSLTEFAMPQLLALITPVVNAIESETEGTVNTAQPGLYPSGDQGDLPCYLVEVEMGLSDQ